MRKNNFKKNQRGITLISLIITIIVLLILAVVSIMLMVNQGILDKAEYAINNYKPSEVNEQVQLAVSHAMMMDGGLNENNLKNALNEAFGDNNYEIKLTDDNTIATIKVYKVEMQVDMKTGKVGKKEITNNTDDPISSTMILVSVPDSWNANTVNCYAWGSQNVENAQWPGLPMTKLDSSENMYCIDLEESDYTNVIFTNDDQSKRTINLDAEYTKVFNIIEPSQINSSETTIYFNNNKYTSCPNAWDYIWINNVNDSGKVPFPGESMTKVSDNVYSAIVNLTTYDRLIFSVGNEGKEYQTDDLTLSDDIKGKTYDYNNNTWGYYYYGGSWSEYK